MKETSWVRPSNVLRHDAVRAFEFACRDDASIGEILFHCIVLLVDFRGWFLHFLKLLHDEDCHCQPFIVHHIREF
jgi:hypothetical protein